MHLTFYARVYCLDCCKSVCKNLTKSSQLEGICGFATTQKTYFHPRLKAIFFSFRIHYIHQIL